METDLFETVRKRLCNAEAKFSAQRTELSGIEDVLRAFEKMYDVCETKQAAGEDTEAIQKLIDVSREKFDKALKSINSKLPTSGSSFDYGMWAHELQCELRLHDPFMLSFEFSSDDDDDGTNSAPTPSSRFSSVITNVLKPDASILKHVEGSSQRRMNRMSNITIVAWLFAVSCMLITLGFLTTDFVHSKKNLAISVQQVRESVMYLPAVSICSTVEGLPTFEDFPTREYPGHPLFTVTTFQNSFRGLSGRDPQSIFHYPNATASTTGSPIEKVYAGKNVTKCESDTSKMSVTRQRQSLFRFSVIRGNRPIGVTLDENPCRSCFRIGAGLRQQIGRNVERPPLTAPVSVNIAVSRVFSSCRVNLERRASQTASRYMISEIKKYLPDLEARGVLDFGPVATGTRAAKEIAINHLFAQAEMAILPYGYDRLCNVYFFAGFFYPSEDDGRVKIVYDAVSETWTDAPGTFMYTTETTTSDIGLGTNASETAAGARGAKAISVSRGLEIYTADPAKAAGTLLVDESQPSAVVDGPSDTFFYFMRSTSPFGGYEYSWKHDTMIVSLEQELKVLYNRFSMGFDYQEFATNTVKMQPTMSWPEYVTDVFEFIGLYTGICIFTLVSRAAGTRRIRQDARANL
jgi:hypothetical protein